MLNLGTGHQLDPTCVFGAGGLEIALQKGVQTRLFFEWCGILPFCIGCCSVCVDTALARPVEDFNKDCLSVARNRVQQFDCRREPPSCLYWYGGFGETYREACSFRGARIMPPCVYWDALTIRLC